MTVPAIQVLLREFVQTGLPWQHLRFFDPDTWFLDSVEPVIPGKKHVAAGLHCTGEMDGVVGIDTMLTAFVVGLFGDVSINIDYPDELVFEIGQNPISQIVRKSLCAAWLVDLGQCQSRRVNLEVAALSQAEDAVGDSSPINSLDQFTLYPSDEYAGIQIGLLICLNHPEFSEGVPLCSGRE